MQPNYSNATWGTVVSVTHDGKTAIRPTGLTKIVTKTWNIGVQTFIHTEDPQFSVSIDLGDRTAEATVLDVDPLWQQWLDEGLITNELLADVAQPQEEIDADEKQRLKSAADSWYEQQVSTGIQVSGTNFYVGITSDDVSLLTGLLIFAQTAVEDQIVSSEGPFTVIDKSLNTHNFTLNELKNFLLAYGQARTAIVSEYAQRCSGDFA